MRNNITKNTSDIGRKGENFTRARKTEERGNFSINIYPHTHIYIKYHRPKSTMLSSPLTQQEFDSTVNMSYWQFHNLWRPPLYKITLTSIGTKALEGSLAALRTPGHVLFRICGGRMAWRLEGDLLLFLLRNHRIFGMRWRAFSTFTLPPCSKMMSTNVRKIDKKERKGARN